MLYNYIYIIVLYSYIFSGRFECLVGQDCPGNDIDRPNVPPLECKKKCIENTACAAYMTNNEGRCWLKSRCDGTKLINKPLHTVCPISMYTIIMY